MDEIKAVSDFVFSKKGGEVAVREFAKMGVWREVAKTSFKFFTFHELECIIKVQIFTKFNKILVVKN